jgi:hypothetical protein
MVKLIIGRKPCYLTELHYYPGCEINIEQLHFDKTKTYTVCVSSKHDIETTDFPYIDEVWKTVFTTKQSRLIGSALLIDLWKEWKDDKINDW